ncbi:MAG TPA: GNAT family N-acetyltransferase [Gaiellaceae bacterium]
MIRDFEPGDAAGVSALLHEQEMPGPLTADGVLHWHTAQPKRARARSWVALEDGRVVGWGRARLRWSTTAEGVADVFAHVHPRLRGHGVGGALFGTAESYARELGARSLQSWADSDAGNAFLERRGFRPTGTQRISALDPRNADTDALPELERALARDGFRLVPLENVRDRVAELHLVYAASSADVPQEFREDDVRLDEWRLETLEHPQLSGAGSFVVLDAERPAALAFLEVDEPAGLAANEMTGTLPEVRRRGLARLAKLATIRWAAEAGISSILTANEERNTGIVALNESLGYEPIGKETQYLRDE